MFAQAVVLWAWTDELMSETCEEYAAYVKAEADVKALHPEIDKDFQHPFHKMSEEALALWGILSQNGINCTLRDGQRPERPELPRADLGAAPPVVITGQIDVLPAQW